MSDLREIAERILKRYSDSGGSPGDDSLMLARAYLALTSEKRTAMKLTVEELLDAIAHLPPATSPGLATLVVKVRAASFTDYQRAVVSDNITIRQLVFTREPFHDGVLRSQRWTIDLEQRS